MRHLGTWSVVVLLAGCTKTNSAAFCHDGTCSDPAFPYCDSDGTIGGEPGTCIAVTCTPMQIAACKGAQAYACDAAGTGYDVVDCAAGCVDSPAPHCAYLQPRYLPDVCDAPAKLDRLVVSSSGTFDPNLDSSCTGGVVTQAGAPSICVVRYGEISIAAGAKLTVSGTLQGSVGRPIALVSDGTLAIAGTLDIGAKGSTNGPGGGVTSSGGPMQVPNAGGGAGFKTTGGAGGNSTMDGGAFNGGAAAANPGLLTALIGGPSAAKAAADDFGGGGGGAATLISCHGQVAVSGTITAGGGGGSGGFHLINNAAGFGGGAGGYVVLQGLSISVTGSAFANGGGGGGGAQSNNADGVRGEDGSLSDSVQARGGTPQGGEGMGGNGGIAGTVPYPGNKPTTSPATAGGGGGSVGFLQTYTPANITPTLTPAHVSPGFEPNATTPTR